MQPVWNYFKNRIKRTHKAGTLLIDIPTSPDFLLCKVWILAIALSATSAIEISLQLTILTITSGDSIQGQTLQMKCFTVLSSSVFIALSVHLVCTVCLYYCMWTKSRVNSLTALSMKRAWTNWITRASASLNNTQNIVRFSKGLFRDISKGKSVQ